MMMLTANAQFGGGFGGGMPMGGGFGFGGQQIKNEDMGCSEKFTDINYAGDDKAYHTLDVYLPEKKADKYPVVVHIYGSAWFSNSSKGMADLGTICTALLKAGYAVACPNHRSSQDAQWPAQSHDIKAAIRFLRAHAAEYNLDPKYIATSGFSSGGHLSSVMAATTGTKTAKVGKLDVDLEGSLGNCLDQPSGIFAAVDFSGPIDLEHMDCAGEREMQFSPEEALLGCPLTKENHDRYRSLSPLAYLDKKDAPIIIFHGTADNVVPFCQGEDWSKAVQKAGVKTEFHPVPDGGHGFNGMYSDENLAAMVRFLDEARGFDRSKQAAAPAAQVSTATSTPAAPSLEYVLTLKVKIDGAFNVGATQHGNRFVIPITGGTFEGPSIRGEVLAGGADYQLQRPDMHRTELEAIYCIRTHDGVSIHVRNWGIIAGEGEQTYFVTQPRFEAPADSPYAWLNDGIYVCRPDFSGGEQGMIKLNVWRVK